jgi:tRNA(Ile)-lysidine synthetase-like protein
MHPNQPRRKLTKLLHQWRIPPWWRGAVPVTCVDGLVVGVLNRVVDPALLAQIDPELTDLEIVWEHQLIEKSGFVYREVSQ